MLDLPSDPALKKAFIQENYQGLMNDRGNSELRNLWYLMRDLGGFSINRKRGLRAGRREKEIFAISWLTIKIFWQDYKSIKNYKKWEPCFEQACDLLDEPSHDLSSFYRRRKNDDRLFSMPEFWTKARRNYQLDDQFDRLKNLPPGQLEGMRSEENLAGLKKIDGLIPRIMKELRRSPKIKTWKLSRQLGIALPHLQPVLEIMEFEHFIKWDRQEKTISTDRWDPKDRRKFVWLHDSAWPRFGPQLQKGKVHNFSDYKRVAVEEWIRLGAATIREGG